MEYGTDFVSDLTADAGTQLVTFAPGSFFVGSARLTLVGGVVYVRGDSHGLQAALGLSTDQANAYADRWVSVPKGDKRYADAAAGLSLRSLLDQVVPQGRLRLVVGPTGQDGPTGVAGPAGETLPVTTGPARGPLLLEPVGFYGATLTARLSDKLPRSYSFAGCIGCFDEGHFSSWNEPLKIDAPAHATPIATVRRLPKATPTHLAPLVRSSPKAALASIVSAALAQKTVHWTQSGVVPRQRKFSMAADVGVGFGEERLTVGDWSGVVRLVGDTAYVWGGPPLLARLALGLTRAQRERYAGTWIAVPKGDEGYARLVDGLTLATIIRSVRLQGPVTLASQTVRGTRHVAVVSRWDHSRFELMVDPTVEPLPSELHTKFDSGGSLTMRFSRWDEPLHVAAPPHATPIAKVRSR